MNYQGLDLDIKKHPEYQRRKQSLITAHSCPVRILAKGPWHLPVSSKDYFILEGLHSSSTGDGSTNIWMSNKFYDQAGRRGKEKLLLSFALMHRGTLSSCSDIYQDIGATG